MRSAFCPHCNRPIIWGTLQNGRARSFEPEPRLLRDVPAAEAFATRRPACWCPTTAVSTAKPARYAALPASAT